MKKIKHLYGCVPGGAIHLYSNESVHSGLCSYARRISPTMLSEYDGGKMCTFCQRYAEARKLGLICSVCGSERVYLSDRMNRPDLVVCAGCGATRVYIGERTTNDD